MERALSASQSSLCPHVWHAGEWSALNAPTLTAHTLIDTQMGKHASAGHSFIGKFIRLFSVKCLVVEPYFLDSMMLLSIGWSYSITFSKTFRRFNHPKASITISISKYPPFRKVWYGRLKNKRSQRTSVQIFRMLLIVICTTG